MALGLGLRRDFMGNPRPNRPAYLLTVVSDLPDDYSDDRASASPFTAPRRGIVWGSETSVGEMPSQKTVGSAPL